MSVLTIKQKNYAMEASNVEIPREFICPITLQMMEHPLTTRSGLNFERSAILDWLEQSGAYIRLNAIFYVLLQSLLTSGFFSGKCPLTRQPLRPSGLIPNRPLEQRIKFWKMNNGIHDLTKDEGMERNSLRFVGFLPVSEKQHEKVIARHDTAASLQSMLANVNEQNAAQRSMNSSSRQRNQHPDLPLNGEQTQRRRNFLLRILSSAQDQLDDF
jgi:hypothetical protein